MSSPVKLFYSNFCEGSKMLVNYISMNDNLQGKVEMICVEAYYKQTGKFPEGLRGTPTIYIENDDHIDAKMHKDAFMYLKKMSTQAQQPTNVSVNKPNPVAPPGYYNPIPEPKQEPMQPNPTAPPTGPNYGSMSKPFGKKNPNMAPLKPMESAPPPPDFSKTGGKPPDGYNPFAVEVKKGSNNNDNPLNKVAQELKDSRYNNASQPLPGGGGAMSYNPVIQM